MDSSEVSSWKWMGESATRGRDATEVITKRTVKQHQFWPPGGGSGGTGAGGELAGGNGWLGWNGEEEEEEEGGARRVDLLRNDTNRFNSYPIRVQEKYWRFLFIRWINLRLLLRLLLAVLLPPPTLGGCIQPRFIPF